MKYTFTLFLFGCLLVTTIQGQTPAFQKWSDTLNNFYDSLDMPVAQALYNQSNPLVVKSEPDGGYFVIWEDQRTNMDIYAQKYDKDGHRLWTENGVPVATGDDHQQYSTISNGVVNYCNYHNANHAASDGNGGFFIAFTTSDHNDVYVQHIKSDGSHVFTDAGYPLAVHASGLNVYYSQPQLITDDNGGFFIGYLQQNIHYNIVVNGYKDEGGTLKSYGGDTLNNGNALSFKIFPDGQGGCCIAWGAYNTVNSIKNSVAFTRLVRVQKDTKAVYAENLANFANGMCGNEIALSFDVPKTGADSIAFLPKRV